MPFFLPITICDLSWGKAPCAIKAAQVIKLRSRADSLSSLDQTSPNKTSSFNSANLGAKSPSLSLPAVCFFIFSPPASHILHL